MSRAGTMFFSAFVVLVLTALPALAAEKGEAVTGSTTGVLLGLLIGVLFGAAVTFYAYKGSTFGESEAEYEYAHDIREGVGGHKPHEQEVGTAVPAGEEPAGSA